jgi:hypothetical protein
MTVRTTSSGSMDLLQRIARALAFAGSVLVGSLALSSSVPATSASAVTAPEFGWALTADQELAPTGASVQRALFELQRARRTLEALADDDTDSSHAYLSALDNLMRPYESADHLVERQVQILASGLEQAWTTLFRTSGPTRGAIACAAVESHPSRPQLVDADLLAAVLVRDEKLVGLVYETLARAQQVFDRNTSFALEPFMDPEAPVATSRVFLVVKARLDVDTGNSRMELLDDWWLDNSHRASGLLSVAIDYV